MSKSNKLVFFGNERLATGLPPIKPVVLPALLKAGYDIEAVIASHADPVSRQKRDLEIGPVAQKAGVPVILPGKQIPLLDKVRPHATQAAVLIAYGRIIPQAVIDLFPKGIINIHPSLLPLYRGPTPLEQTILDGVSQTGVSLMKLEAEMDAGPVYAQAAVKLGGQETKVELAELLLRTGADLLIKHLPSMLDGSLAPSPQGSAKASYTHLLSKADGQLDFKQPAELLERQVRAYAGFPKARAELHGHEVIINKVRLAGNESDGALVIPCQPGWLEILELTAPSGRTMSGADFLRGYKAI